MVGNSQGLRPSNFLYIRLSSLQNCSRPNCINGYKNNVLIMHGLNKMDAGDVFNVVTVFSDELNSLDRYHQGIYF